MITFDDVIALALPIGSIYFFIRVLHKPKLREIDTELLNRLDKIYYLKQQYVKTQELLWDMDLTNPKDLKAIDLEWLSVTGEKREANIWTDGKSRTTKRLRLAVEARLDEIKINLNRELDLIPKRSDTPIDIIEDDIESERHRQNVDKTKRFVYKTIRHITMGRRGR